jgi:DtxR family transcriptional regulator, Mn-dependent transcriptional regulator
MTNKLTESIEDYLEAISILATRDKVVRVKDIAAFLDVKMPSVNSALKTLKEKELIMHESYGDVELTEKGLKAAQEIYVRHKLISQFFQEVLGLPYEVANDDACKVEHCLSRETIEKLAAFMATIEEHAENQPEWLELFRNSMKKKKFTTRSEDFIKKGLINLTRSPEGKKFTILGIDGTQAVKQKLAALGLVPEVSLSIIENQSGHIIVEVKGTRIPLSGNVATKLWGKIK